MVLQRFVTVMALMVLVDANYWEADYKPRERLPRQKLRTKIANLAHQLLMQQFYVEQQTRANGQSGLKVMRLRKEGTRPYHGASHSDDYSCSSTHDHPDFFNTIGMGEMVAVLNGVEFWTRHNDFLLNMKSETNKTYGAVQDITYPDVPESVTACKTIKAQIKEMKKYFEAWQKQDKDIRDYTKYFKANLCYMEGTWAKYDPEDIQEAFFSERHWYEAESWSDLFQKMRFSAYTGTKDNKENYGFLPTTLWEVDDNGNAVFGQWNYRIYCQPLKDDLPLNRLRAVDDLKIRMSSLKTFQQYVNSRSARFSINPLDKDKWYDGSSKYGLMDELMYQIPGMNNGGAVLNSVSYGNVIKKFTAPASSKEPLNTAYYHRSYQNAEIGALGIKVRNRGYNDKNLWMAMTTQENVLPIKVQSCKTDKITGIRSCKWYEEKWSYGIPLEIVYTTPLHAWNPYHIVHKGYDKSELGKTVFQGPSGTKRTGGEDKDKAFNGTNSSKFYMTPYEFFEAGEVGVDPADTPKNSVYVLDKDGVVRKVRGSGIRTFLPKISGLPKMRTRYLIPPIFSEGSPLGMEMDALKEIVLNPKRYDFMFHDNPNPVVRPIQLTLTAGTSGHTHDVVLGEYEQEQLNNGHKVTVLSTFANNHQHSLVIESKGHGKRARYQYTLCTGEPTCRDGHPPKLEVQDEDNW